MKKIDEMDARITELENSQNSICITVGAMLLVGAVALPVIGLVKGTKAVVKAVKNAKEKKAEKAAAAEEAAKEEAEEASPDF